MGKITLITLITRKVHNGNQCEMLPHHFFFKMNFFYEYQGIKLSKIVP